ncbi:UNVERIFIED_CONTAM: Transcription initiation factor TFIID subunit [Sesamum angustifolium]|uniref:Transcription initiation factor TFIID subunit n=1 Tax=Sesamum angustifolium TaxID=2727405 RepID=A0AAW2PC80_9LAMI
MSIVPKETIEVIAQSIGITNLSPDVLPALAADVEYRVREIMQEAIKCMRHSRRTTLTTDDVDSALGLRNVEPIYGFASGDPLRFKRAAGHKDLFYVEDKDVEFKEVIEAPLPKAPLDTAVVAHWLAIEGVQPAIPENPPPEALQTLSMPSDNRKTEFKDDGVPVDIKLPIKHVLSRELQILSWWCSFTLRNHRVDSNLVASICKRFGHVYHNLQPRVTRTLLHAFLDPSKALPQHYGAIQGLGALGPNVVRLLVLPNLEPYLRLLEPEMQLEKQKNEMKRHEAWLVYGALMRAAGLCMYDRLKMLPSLLSPPARTVWKSNSKVLTTGSNKRKASMDNMMHQPPLKKLATDSSVGVITPNSLPVDMPGTSSGYSANVGVDSNMQSSRPLTNNNAWVKWQKGDCWWSRAEAISYS